MNPEVDKELLLSASRAVVGHSTTLTIQTVAEACELWYRRGLSKGYDKGYVDGADHVCPVTSFGDAPHDIAG